LLQRCKRKPLKLVSVAHGESAPRAYPVRDDNDFLSNIT
jgi:hypothetical protein